MTRLQLPAHLRRALRERAKRERTTVAELLERIVNRSLDEEGKMN